MVSSFIRACIVAVLVLSASGAHSVLMLEPCGVNEAAGAPDAACPPTCVTCGCCAQAAEPLTLSPIAMSQVIRGAVVLRVPPLATIDPRDILHVPRHRLA